MFDHTPSTLNAHHEFTSDATISREDRSILSCLACQVADLAARPIEDEKRQLWNEHNALKPTRPLIFCDPEYGWNEIITQDQIECRGELARHWETALRKEIFWGQKCVTIGSSKRSSSFPMFSMRAIGVCMKR